MNLPELKGLNVLIIGCPASGKTFLANNLKSDNHKIIHTDDYMRYGYKESLYVMIEDIQKLHVHTKSIVEGIQGYRLLRKGVELNCYHPDIVVQLEISEARMLQTYRTERPGKKIDSLYAFNNMHDKILNDYFRMYNPHKPKWLKIKNEY